MKNSHIAKTLLEFFVINSSFIALPVLGDNLPYSSSSQTVTTGDAVVYETKAVEESYISVSDDAELIQALKDGQDILLKHDITLTNFCQVKTSAKVHINMDKHTITVPANGYGEFTGPFIFENGPEGKPMFATEGKAYLALKDGAAINIDGDGSTGIYIKNNSWLSIYNAVFNVNGNNCTGIESENSLDFNSECSVDFSEIYVNGNNCTGISCDNDVAKSNNAYAKLLFDKIIVSGENSSSVKGQKVICDSSYISPAAENQTSIKRNVTHFIQPEDSHKQLPVNSEPLTLKDETRVEAENVENPDDTISIVMPVKWRDDVDYNTIGSYRIYGDIVYPFDNIEPMTFTSGNYITVDIKDPKVLDLSFISDVNYDYGDDNSEKCSLEIAFLEEHLNSQDNVLYISEDSGKTWNIYKECSLKGKKLSIGKLDYDKEYKFEYVLADGTKSDVLTIKINPDKTYTSLTNKHDNNDLDLLQIEPDNNDESNDSTYGNNDENNVSDINNSNDNNTSSDSSHKNKYNNSSSKSSNSSTENNFPAIEVFSADNSNFIAANNANEKIFSDNTVQGTKDSCTGQTADNNQNTMKEDIENNRSSMKEDTEKENNNRGNIKKNTEKENSDKENSKNNMKKDTEEQDSRKEKNENLANKETVADKEEKTNENKKDLKNESKNKMKAVAAIAFSAICAGGIIYIMKGKFR